VEGFEIRPVEDAKTLRTWVQVFIGGYGLPQAWAGMIFDTWTSLSLNSQMRNYLGFWNGIPVATSCLFFGGGAAGIYSVATLPEARGNCIGATLTLHPLLEAREAGYRIGVLQSSDMGYGVYKKLGFRHLCQIENFSLRLA